MTPRAAGKVTGACCGDSGARFRPECAKVESVTNDLPLMNPLVSLHASDSNCEHIDCMCRSGVPRHQTFYERGRAVV